MSCKSSQVNDLQINTDLFPSPPSAIDEKTGEPVILWVDEIWFKKSEFDEALNISLKDVVVMPDWYWIKLFDYILDTEYAIDCINLKVNGDP